MRRMAFILLLSLFVGVGTASPAHGYWSLFHYPHHIPHARPHHGGHPGAYYGYGATPSSDPNAFTAGQVFRGIQLLWPLVTGQPLPQLPQLPQQPQQPQQPQPAAEPRVSAATSEQITKTGLAVNKSVDNVNDLLKMVREGDSRLKDTLKDVPKTAAAKDGSDNFGPDGMIPPGSVTPKR